ncbi:uncharacterized protein V6R79_006665 [Siganus canaliculatus]
MALRRPDAHLRRSAGWRRSGDESYWENLIAEENVLATVKRPQRARRPRSAIEGGQLDRWLEHLQRLQKDLLREPVHDQVPAYNDRTTSMPALHKDPARHAWRQPGIPSFSRASSSCGSPSLYESSLGSQESLRTGIYSPPEHRGSWERAHIMQTPKKEQTQLSNLAPVKIGWLPIQRKVTVPDGFSRGKLLDHSAGQVHLKQPITPTFWKNHNAANRHPDEMLKRSHTTPSSFGVKTWQTPDRESPITTQVPEKQTSPANDGDRPVAWPALRRSWNSSRVAAFPSDTHLDEFSTGISTDSNRKSPLIKTTSVEPLKHTIQRTSTDLCKPDALLLQGTNSTGTYKSPTPLHRTSSVQPVRATVPLCRTNSSSQASHTQTNSAVTTIIPQNKAGFSSITISSRKVSRSASLPGSNGRAPQSSEIPSSPVANQAMEPNSRQVTVQRKATIVKVTEQRVLSNPSSTTDRTGSPAVGHALDTVVHRRKATIIKVTEHRESYSPAKGDSGTRRPEYRHSYTDGVLKENSKWNPGNHLQHSAISSYKDHDSTKSPNPVSVAPNKTSSEAQKQDGELHRSTLNLFVSTSPALPAPAPSEVPLRAVGWRSDRRSRPVSCYGNVFGHAEPSEENGTRPGARKWSFELPQETSFSSESQTAVKVAGQPAADTSGPSNGERDRVTSGNGERRASPSLTLIKTPDPHSNQSPEEVLALNAAAIIANIKLQRQHSKKKTPNDSSKKDSGASPQGNTDEGRYVKPQRDQTSNLPYCSKPHAAFVPLGLDPERSSEVFSLQEALQRSRPDFISRSRGRMRELERRKQKRREVANSVKTQSNAASRQRRTHSAAPVNDNLYKARDRAISGKEMQLSSKRTPAEVKRKREEEKKKEASLSSRQRVELFRKRLLDQILQRSSS